MCSPMDFDDFIFSFLIISEFKKKKKKAFLGHLFEVQQTLCAHTHLSH